MKITRQENHRGKKDMWREVRGEKTNGRKSADPTSASKYVFLINLDGASLVVPVRFDWNVSNQIAKLNYLLYNCIYIETRAGSVFDQPGFQTPPPPLPPQTCR